MPDSPSAAPIGIVIHSWWKRWKGNYASETYPAFHDALEVLDYCKRLGAAGLQIMVDKWTDDFARGVTVRCMKHGLYLEGSITLPKDAAEVDYFEATLRRAKNAGVVIFRTALGGRRYELFQTHAAFQEYKATAEAALRLAAPVAEKYGVRIGVENHKDLHAAELAEMLTKLGSAAMGACIDTGNNLALLEEPLQVIETLAPLAVTVHLKDMAVQPTAEGFLLAEVALGEGMLDIQGMVDTIRARSPNASINLEMITRDPLNIPCLTPGYWPTFPDKPATELAMALGSVSQYAAPKLTTLSNKELESALLLEDTNIRASLKYARESLTP